MLKNYLILQTKKAKYLKKTDAMLALMLYLISQVCFISIIHYLFVLNDMFYIMFFFFCIGIIAFLLTSTLEKEKERIFLKNIIISFNEKQWIGLEHLSFEILIVLPMIGVLKFWILPIFFIYSLGGLLALKIKILVYSKINNKKISHLYLLKIPALWKKELLNFKRTPFQVIFVLIFFAVVFFPKLDLKYQMGLLFLLSLVFNDSFTLNSIGIEFKNIQFLIKEGHMCYKKAVKKFIFWFCSGFILLILTAIIKVEQASSFTNILFFQLIIFYIINFYWSACLGLRFPKQEGSLMKVKIIAIYLEIFGMILIVVGFYQLSSELFFILTGLAIIVLDFLFRKLLRSYFYGYRD